MDLIRFIIWQFPAESHTTNEETRLEKLEQELSENNFQQTVRNCQETVQESICSQENTKIEKPDETHLNYQHTSLLIDPLIFWKRIQNIHQPIFQVIVQEPGQFTHFIALSDRGQGETTQLMTYYQRLYQQTKDLLNSTWTPENFDLKLAQFKLSLGLLFFCYHGDCRRFIKKNTINQGLFQLFNGQKSSVVSIEIGHLADKISLYKLPSLSKAVRSNYFPTDKIY